MGSSVLLSIVEQGGYESFRPLYEAKGFLVVENNSVKNALKRLKQNSAEVIVAEFNFQSDFRERSSSLESLLATVQWLPNVRVIVLFDKEWQEKLNNLLEIHSVYETIPFPISESHLALSLENILVEN